MACIEEHAKVSNFWSLLQHFANALNKGTHLLRLEAVILEVFVQDKLIRRGVAEIVCSDETSTI